jgi:patatin-like phospholipase/acyl hydrolase
MARPRFILSIDGGGIRGIIPATVLISFEKKIKKRKLKGHLADYFDLIAGTSTGGIIAAGLSAPARGGRTRKPALTAQELLDLYVDDGKAIFSRSIFRRIREAFSDFRSVFQERYDSEALEDILVKKLGDSKLSDALTGVMMTAYDLEKRQAVFMTNGKDSSGKQSEDYLFWQACRATSAAPTYFEPARVCCFRADSEDTDWQTLIDGGVFANDPSMAALTEARKNAFDIDSTYMLSIGTGYQNRPFEYKEAKNWGALSWISPAQGSPIISILMQGQASSASYQMKKLMNKGKKDRRYFRIDGPLTKGMDELDDASNTNIEALKMRGNEIAEEFDNDLDAFADIVAEAHSTSRQSGSR